MNLEPYHIKNRIIFMIANNSKLIEIRTFFIELKENGITKELVYQLLEDILREHNSEYNEDIILELMDIASNWCSKPLRVWE